jgi:hypothetical protein
VPPFQAQFSASTLTAIDIAHQTMNAGKRDCCLWSTRRGLEFVDILGRIEEGKNSGSLFRDYFKHYVELTLQMKECCIVMFPF